MQIIVENLNIVQRIATRLSICAKPDNQDFSAYTIDLKAGDFIVFMIIVSPGPSIIIPRSVPEGCPATNLRFCTMTPRIGGRYCQYSLTLVLHDRCHRIAPQLGYFYPHG